VVGQRKGPGGANAPPVHGIKKCLVNPYYFHSKDFEKNSK
jgi:hypothetical protein